MAVFGALVSGSFLAGLRASLLIGAALLLVSTAVAVFRGPAERRGAAASRARSE